MAVSANQPAAFFPPSLLSERLDGTCSSASLLPAGHKRDAPLSEIDDLIREALTVTPRGDETLVG